MELKQQDSMGMALSPGALKAGAYSEDKNDGFLLRMRGLSMAPKYTGGELLVCKRVEDKPFIQWGKVFAISSKSQGTIIRRLYPSDKEGWYKCVSDNPDYAPFDIPQCDIDALAMIVGSISMEV